MHKIEGLIPLAGGLAIVLLVVAMQNGQSTVPGLIAWPIVAAVVWYAWHNVSHNDAGIMGTVILVGVVVCVGWLILITIGVVDSDAPSKLLGIQDWPTLTERLQK